MPQNLLGTCSLCHTCQGFPETPGSPTGNAVLGRNGLVIRAGRRGWRLYFTFLGRHKIPQAQCWDVV